MVAITSGVKDMQAVLNLVWDNLLPAMKPAPLATDDDARKKLERTLAGLRCVPRRARARPTQRACRARSTCSRPTSGNSKRSRSKSDGKGDAVTLVARFDGSDQRITVRPRRMAEGAAGVWAASRATGGGQRRLDRGRHLHGEDLLLRDAVHPHDPLEVLRGPSCSSIPSPTSRSARHGNRNWSVRPSRPHGAQQPLGFSPRGSLQFPERRDDFQPDGAKGGEHAAEEAHGDGHDHGHGRDQPAEAEARSRPRRSCRS